MKSELMEIVKYVSVLPFDIIKVTGNEGAITLQSRLQDQVNGSIVFVGKLKNKVSDFEGVFGLSNLSMLSGLLSVSQFTDKEATIAMKRRVKNEISIPEELTFENAKFGKASYRLTSEKAIPPQMKAMAEIKWDVVIPEVSKSTIDKFTKLAGIYSSQESKFSVKADGKQLKFLIGEEEAATHKAQFVFNEDITGTIKSNFTWSIPGVLNVMKLISTPDVAMEMKISNQGVLQIEAKSSLGTYQYIMAGSN